MRIGPFLGLAALVYPIELFVYPSLEVRQYMSSRPVLFCDCFGILDA